MIDNKFIAAILIMELLLSMGVAGQMQVFDSPLSQAQPIQSGSGFPTGDESFITSPPLAEQPIQGSEGSSSVYMVYPETILLEAQPKSGSESSNTGWPGSKPIDSYDVVQFSNTIGDELAAINCYSGGKQIAHLYFLDTDSLPGNFVESEIAVLYYQYDRYNDVLDMLNAGGEIYLVFFSKNSARIERRSIKVPKIY